MNEVTRAEIERGQVGKGAMALATTARKQEALYAMATALREQTAVILSANAQDMDVACGEIPLVMLDRLRLDEERVEAMAKGMEEVAALGDPVGRVLSQECRPNGLVIDKVLCPMGVIAIIYESRPNVTSDAAALALMSGSACILRGGKEARHSTAAIVDALHHGLSKVGLPNEVLTLLSDPQRESATDLMTAKGLVDLLIPRGGRGLISACVEHATVPVVETGTGVCHAYVDAHANLSMALDIVENGKVSRPSVCNSLEVCLVHREVAEEFLQALHNRLVVERKQQRLEEVELRLCQRGLGMVEGVPASDVDYHCEFLNYILAVKVVDSLEEAIAHIAEHSTGHSEVIITEQQEQAKKFTMQVDSAAVYVNASTRFTDGGQFGLGCEMGISTQKLHARGPMGLEELCSYKYVITGNGNVRV